MTERSGSQRRRRMGDLVIWALLLGGYVALQRYILPRLGVPT